MLRKPVFVIGDVHGHMDRLTSLLQKAGFLDGDGRQTEQCKVAQVIQLGDLGHYGHETVERDLTVWRFATNYRTWFRPLMGNHEAALLDPGQHGFRGMKAPHSETIGLIRSVAPTHAVLRHGHILTHAGVHPYYWPFTDGTVEQTLRTFVTMTNSTCDVGGNYVPIRDNISRYRGGSDQQGGILWRDFREHILDVPQVYGHSRSHDVRHDGQTWCIDVADKDDGNLAGLWLPDLKVVAIGPDYHWIEGPHV